MYLARYPWSDENHESVIKRSSELSLQRHLPSLRTWSEKWELMVRIPGDRPWMICGIHPLGSLKGQGSEPTVWTGGHELVCPNVWRVFR